MGSQSEPKEMRGLGLHGASRLSSSKKTNHMLMWAMLLPFLGLWECSKTCVGYAAWSPSWSAVLQTRIEKTNVSLHGYITKKISKRGLRGYSTLMKPCLVAALLAAV
jgi:hypothetical protein